MNRDPAFDQIDQIFRQSYGQLVASLISRFGLAQVNSAENAAMEAFYKALKVWPLQGIPNQPKAWLFTVSQRKMIDEFRKNRKVDNYDKVPEISIQAPPEVLLEDIKDPELRLLFIICHPRLKKEDRLAFMLKLLSGFGIREIANALLQNEEAIKKRLSRARQVLRNEDVHFALPKKEALTERQDLVHTAIYLLFNEGYYSSLPDRWIQKEFCLEAMRLCKYLCDHPLANADTFALMSLMCYHISRFESRIDQSHNMILLKDQDRSVWDAQFIELGAYYLEKSMSLTEMKTAFQLEAFISAQHSTAASFEKTNWDLLDTLYTRLHQLKQSDVVLLNLIMVKIQRRKLKEAQSMFELFEVGKLKQSKSIYYLVGAELYHQLSGAFASTQWIHRALNDIQNKKVTEALLDRLNEYEAPN